MQGITILALWIMGIPASGQVLYNLDFNNQPANSLVQTGAPPQFVSRINFGSPTVVSSFGGLHDQPLRLALGGSGPGYYHQIQLNLSPPQSSALDVSFDFTSFGLVGSQAPGVFTVLFDGPGVNQVHFDSSGTISVFNGHTFTLGHFTSNETFHVLIQVDVPNQTYSIFKDGALLGTAAFPAQIPIEDIRFNYGVNSITGKPDSSAAAIDNVLVVAVPEPSIFGLVSLAGLTFVVLKQRQLRRCSKPIATRA